MQLTKEAKKCREKEYKNIRTRELAGGVEIELRTVLYIQQATACLSCKFASLCTKSIIQEVKNREQGEGGGQLHVNLTKLSAYKAKL